MSAKPGISERQGVIAQLAVLHAKKGAVLGKTALQKEIYFLQNLFGVNCGYHFSLYTYGPFSQSLLEDLDDLRSTEKVDIDFNRGGSGYDISPGARSEVALGDAVEFLSNHQKQIREVVDRFGEMSAGDLELRATIVFASRNLGDTIPEAELVETVARIKPRFSQVIIQNAVVEMRKEGYVAVK